MKYSANVELLTSLSQTVVVYCRRIV